MHGCARSTVGVCEWCVLFAGYPRMVCVVCRVPSNGVCCLQGALCATISLYALCATISLCPSSGFPPPLCHPTRTLTPLPNPILCPLDSPCPSLAVPHNNRDCMTSFPPSIVSALSEFGVGGGAREGGERDRQHPALVNNRLLGLLTCKRAGRDATENQTAPHQHQVTKLCPLRVFQKTHYS